MVTLPPIRCGPRPALTSPPPLPLSLLPPPSSHSSPARIGGGPGSDGGGRRPRAAWFGRGRGNGRSVGRGDLKSRADDVARLGSRAKPPGPAIAVGVCPTTTSAKVDRVDAFRGRSGPGATSSASGVGISRGGPPLHDEQDLDRRCAGL